MDERTLARFLSKVDKNGPVPVKRPELGPCWIWKPVPSNGGYGQFYLNGKPQLAHRASYKLFAGPIPDGLTIDHLCSVRACVRPDHLEAVTLLENLRRARVWEAGAAFQRDKTHCANGHSYSGDNLRICKDGKRACRTCAREQMAARRERQRAENPPRPRRLKEFCVNGHSFAEHGVFRGGKRVCVECARDRVRRSRVKRKAGRGPKPPKLTCKYGHPWTEENIYTDPKGRKACRACHNAATLARYYEAKAATPPEPPRPPRTHCANGHDWVPANVYVTPAGHEKCRICARERNRRYETRRKVAAS